MSDRYWLLVEDEPDIYDIIVAIFDSFGVECYAHTLGEDAAEWIGAVDEGALTIHTPDLALIDIRLPGQMDGAAVAAALRRSKRFRNVAIVLMTAYHLSPAEEKEILARAGADRLIYKPLPGAIQLREQLEDAIESRRKRR